jgi:8-oxo-dGTP diphosphatase
MFSLFDLMILASIRCTEAANCRVRVRKCYIAIYAERVTEPFQREFPKTPIIGVGAIAVDGGRVLLVQRGQEPSKGKWSLPGGMLELGESLHEGVIREVLEETGLKVEPVELIELLERIVYEENPGGKRVRYHYVIADYLCRVVGGSLQASSDAEAVRWVEQAEWNSHSAFALDPITVRVIEAASQRAARLQREKGSL